MSITLGIVEVPPLRCNTPPLALRRFGDATLVEWVVRRVTESLLVEQVMVVADAEQRDFLFRLLPADIVLFDGSQQDRLACFAAATRRTDASSIVRVPVECPFIDPSFIDRLICDAGAHPGCDYIGYIASSAPAGLRSRLGVFAEWLRGDALFRAERAATSPEDRVTCTRYIHSHPETFQLRLIPAPPVIDRDDIRLAIDAEEDWEHAQLIYDALGPDQLDWRSIADLLEHQPGLRRRMAALNHTGEPSRGQGNAC